MTPDQIRQVDAVIEAIGRHPEFGARFYERLFTAAPDTRAMFGDVEAQQRKITDELGAMVAMLADLGGLEARAQDLGARHRGYGVQASQYRLVREVMADTLSEVLGDEFGPERKEAWNRATSLITELMMSS